MIRTILFDLDGTLVDSYLPITESLNEVRSAFGLPSKSEAEVRREVGRGLEALIGDNVGADRVEEGVRIFRDCYRRIFREGTRLLPGVASTIETLAGRGYAMGVTSNKPAYFTREILIALGIASTFGAIYGPEMVTHPKPHPEMIHGALAELRSHPDSTVPLMAPDGSEDSPPTTPPRAAPTTPPAATLRCLCGGNIRLAPGPGRSASSTSRLLGRPARTTFNSTGSHGFLSRSAP